MAFAIEMAFPATTETNETAFEMALSALVIWAELAAMALVAVDRDDCTEFTRVSTEARFTDSVDALLLAALAILTAFAATAEIALSALVIWALFAVIALVAVEREDWTDVTRLSTEARLTERVDALLLAAFAILTAFAATALMALSALVIWALFAAMALTAVEREDCTESTRSDKPCAAALSSLLVTEAAPPVPLLALTRFTRDVCASDNRETAFDTVLIPDAAAADTAETSVEVTDPTPAAIVEATHCASAEFHVSTC
jgi:uncharacterized membrane protein YqjE